MRKDYYYFICMGVCFLLLCSALQSFAGGCQDEWISDDPEQIHNLSTVWSQSIPGDCHAVCAKITITLQVHNYGTTGILDVICSNTNQFDWGRVYWPSDPISKAGWIGRIDVPPTFVQGGWQTVSFPLRHIHLDWLNDDGTLYFELFGPAYFQGEPNAQFSIKSCTLEMVECEADFDDDLDIDGTDLTYFLTDFGRVDCAGDCFGDFDNNGAVDQNDLLEFSEEFGWGVCPLGFYNDFDAGQLNGWYTYDPGIWSAGDGVLRMTGSSPDGGANRYAYYIEEYSDFAFEIQLNRIQGVLDYASGIIFRSGGIWTNRYRIYLAEVGGHAYYQIDKNVNGVNTVLVSWTESSHIKTGYGVWNTIRVVSIGSKINLYINDIHVRYIEDSEFSSGRIGVYATDLADGTGTNTIVHFDNARLVAY